LKRKDVEYKIISTSSSSHTL